MKHIHSVLDTDPHFVVDSRTRVITDQSTTPTSLMQYDHNSVRLTFEIPRTIDEHDMSKCDRVEIHFINIGTNSKRSNGLYLVDDLAIDANDDNVVTCTWLIAQDATSLVGTLSFVLRFMCTHDGVVDYIWNTAVYPSIQVGAGMNTSADATAKYADALQEWYDELIGAVNNGLAQIEQSKDNLISTMKAEEMVEAVSDAAADRAVEKLNVDNIVNEVLERLPRAEGANF